MSEFTHPNDKIYLLLGEMRGDIKALLAATHDIKKELVVHDNRIDNLEKGRAYLMGAAAALGAAISAGYQYLTKFNT